MTHLPWTFVPMVLAVLAALAWPLFRRAKPARERGVFDRAVYRDQLTEVDRDLARGVLRQEEAEAARLEIQRRLLAVDTLQGPPQADSGPSPVLALAAGAFVVVLAGGLYWRLGSPTLADAPFASRAAADTAVASSDGKPPPHQDMKLAAEKLEAKLRANPSDGEGWVLFARTLSMLGDWERAGGAYQRALDLGLRSPDVFSGLGEMRVMAEDGVVSPAAKAAFTSALVADPGSDVARYYLALASAQAGDVKEAIAAWRDLAADIPADSPMYEEIARRVADAARTDGVPVEPLPKGRSPEKVAGGPTPEQMAAAETMSPDDRDKMVRAMTDRLAARMADTPGDLDGWLRLGKAYAVLNETEKAVDAYEHAIRLRPDESRIKIQAAVALLTPAKSDDPIPARAVTLLREVQAVAPDQPEVLWYLGVVAARDGQLNDARRDWTLLLSKLPAGGEDQKMVQAALDQIKGP
jgi:cytochrome c-type biogenesis protein CcmH